ncbi:MAG: hypothetical protein R2731_15930 [Nocardioides sp.]
MRMSRSRPEHQQAVSRRLALLGAELAAVRGDEVPDEPPATSPATPDTHTRIRPGRLSDWLAAEGWAGPDADSVAQPVAQPVAPRSLHPSALRARCWRCSGPRGARRIGRPAAPGVACVGATPSPDLNRIGVPWSCRWCSVTTPDWRRLAHWPAK